MADPSVEARRDCWHVSYGDVAVGTIARRVGAETTSVPHRKQCQSLHRHSVIVDGRLDNRVSLARAILRDLTLWGRRFYSDLLAWQILLSRGYNRPLAEVP